MRVWINNGDTRKEVKVKLVKKNIKTLIVELPDGNIIKRKIYRDLIGDFK